MSEETVKVSVVMPVYNAEEYVEECITSVLDQSLQNFEFVIVDDCSSDGTWSIIQEYEENDTRIKAFRNEENLGVVKTRNRAFSKVCGSSEYVAIMDSDDVCLSERLEKQVLFLERHEDHGVVGGNTVIINEEGERIGHREYPRTNEEVQRELIFRSPFAQPAVMLRRSILRRVGEYNEEYERAQDYELWFRVLSISKGANLQEDVLKYRVSESQGKSTALKETLRNTLKIQRRYLLKERYFSVRAGLYHVLHYPLFLVPSRIIKYVFMKIRY